MAKYTITYSVELDPQTDNGGLEASFWLTRTLSNPDINLPDHVSWVQTVPQVAEVKPKATPSTEKLKKGDN